MRQFLLGLAVGIVITFVTGFLILLAVARLGDNKPGIGDESVLTVRWEGQVPEANPVQVPFFQSAPHLTVLENYQVFRQAAKDSRIKAIVVEPYGVQAGWGKLHELREAMLEFRKSGKPLIASLHSPGSREYYLATAADKIYMTPTDLLDVKGLRAESVFLKGTLDKLGVQIEAERVGRYKGAPELFTRTSLSPESREVVESMLTGVYNELTQAIATGRKHNLIEIQTAVDKGPFLAKDAKQLGLIDDLLYEDQLSAELTKRTGLKEVHKVGAREFAKAMQSDKASGKKIAVVTAEGDITRGNPNETDSSDSGITAFGFNKLLREVQNDSSVQGVILRIDSGGGDAIASDEILREVKNLSKKKPLVISFSDAAASGGYYMAVPGDPIVAYPNTITGSIGIFFLKATLRGLYDKIGITKDILTRGNNAAIDTDYAPLTDSGRAKLRESIETFYRGFVQVVADGRHRSYADIDGKAQGRVWVGTLAKENGLVDELGGFDKALQILRTKAKIDAKETLQLVAYPPKRSIVEQLLNRSGENVLESAAPPELRELSQQINPKLILKGGMMSYQSLRVTVK